MFMRENRKKNGAVQPEATAAKDSSAQRGARKLAPNEPVPEKPEDWRFTPDMSSCDAINDAHYEGGLNDGPYGKSYEEHIPFVGVPDSMSQKSRKLAPAP